MNKAELKQKLEAVRDSEKYSLLQWPKQDDEYEGTHVAEGEYPSHYRDSVRKAFEAGRDSLLPLLLDAYEALELALSFCPKGPVPERLSPEFYHTLDYLEELKLQERVNESRATLTRIEAFATQGAHEQSEFENGEK